MDWNERRKLLWECPFFGLTDEYKVNLHETLFDLCYFGKLGYDAVYSMPVQYRNFYIRKLVDVKEREKAQMDKSQGMTNAPSTKMPSIARGPAINSNR